ncbi:MAG: DUF4842 domain-containing protein [Prevotellaceae bacterium]|nr:DUF4842 domain-containing protein [Prevotellaceae bacterium]
MKTTKSLILPIILAALIITSCSDYDNGYTEKTIRYERAFYDAFGQIDPNQDWNLVKQLRNKNGGGMSTRAVGSYDNRNMWIFPVKDNNGKIIDFTYLYGYNGNTDVTVIPGFPAEYDGKYHVMFSGNGSEEVFDSKQALIDYMNQNNKNEVWPAGDVTDEEILFVSRWFRAHKLGENHEFPCTKFYIQQISSDVDLVSYPTWDDATNKEVGEPGAMVTNATQYQNGNVTQGRGLQYAMTRLAMSDTPGQESHINDFNRLEANFRPLDETTHNFGRSINFIEIGDVSNVDFASNGDGGTKPVANESGYYFDHWTLQYLSFDINGRHYEGWYLGLDYEFYMDHTNNNIEKKERDYHFNNWILKITPAYSVPKPDIPTIPVDPEPDPEPTEEILEAGLLCCEDMGGAEADFDFNDIVLKLEHKRRTATENGETSTKDIFVVTAMAAGGTLPSYVFYKPLKDAETLNLEWGDQWMNEAMKSDGWVPFKTEDDDVSNGIHDMWDAKDLSGQTTFEPLNVDQKFKGEGHSWEVDVTAAIDLLKTYTNADEEQQERIRHYADHYVSYVFDRIRIRVYVDPVMNADGSVNIASPNSNYIEPIYHGMHESGEYSDYRDAERPPQMILLPLRFEWPTESTFIGEAYEYFTEWVRDTGKTDWYLYKTSDDHVTSRDVDGEELQPRLRWGAIDDGTEEIYMSVTLPQGGSMTIPFTTLSDGGFTTSSSDQNVAYATNVNATSKEITIAANNPGTATITLTQDATSLYRAENIMLYVTVEGNGVTPEPEPEPQPGEGEYTEVQVNTDSYGWGHTIIKSQSSTFGKDYPYGAWIKIVFSETPSNLRVYNGDPLNTSWTANSKEFIFELTDIDMMKLANKALTIEFDKIDENVKMYIKPKTAEEVYGTIAEWTYSNKVEGDDQYNYSNVYTVSAGSLANCTAGTIITFVAEMYCNYKYYIGNYQQSGNWQFGNSGYLKITLTADQAAEARKSGIRLLTSSTLSNPQIYIKSAGSNAKKRRTARR